MNPVLTKREMYPRLQAGEFGNTNAQWTGAYARWFCDTCNDPRWVHQKLWGVRHARLSGWPGTKLNVPTADVLPVINAGNFGNDFNISPMVPECIRWEGDVCRGYCSGNLRPVSGSWRVHMLHPRLWEGSAAIALMKSVLNENSYDDLMILLDEYPDHVIELSALDVCYGTVPGRNAVIWECRKY